MDTSQKDLKLQKWQTYLKILQTQILPEALKRIGETGAEGDLRENIAYEEAEREVYRLQDKIDEVKKIIDKLEKETK